MLELATGRGATSSWLAKRYPHVQFHGVDLSPGQFGFALKAAKKLPNYRPILGDFHDLHSYQDHSMDVVFEIEALCYSTRKSRVFSEIHRVLKPRGVCILLDGYLGKPREQMRPIEAQAITITEKAMAVSAFEEFPQVMEYASKASLQIISDEDVSQFIMPTLRRFENLANFMFHLPWLTKAIISLYPLEFTGNAAVGFLFPAVMNNGLGSYHITVLQRE